MPGKIYVVGAGPGDPELITVRAVRILSSADVVAYGELVNEEIVNRYAPRAVKVRIGHRREEHDRVVEELLAEASRGKNVVILKNGDPTIFGRAMHVCRTARNYGVECEIVPGVSSFVAAAAQFNIPLTDVEGPRTLCLATYPHLTSVEEIRGVDTLVVFMMSKHVEDLAKVILSKFGDVPVYVCQKVSYPEGSCELVRASELPSLKPTGPTLFIIYTSQGKYISNR